jgi:hypothetical protein
MTSSFLLNVPNTPEGLETITRIRKYLKVRVRGRGPRKEIFAKTGRVYFSGTANKNDFSLKSPEAQYATYWGVYVIRKPADCWKGAPLDFPPKV